MKKMTGKNTLMLFLTAFIWGSAFVAQSVGMDYVGPFTFSCVRSFIGGIFLIPCIWFLDQWRAKNDGTEGGKKAVSKEEKKMDELDESKEEIYSEESTYNSYDASKNCEKEYIDLNDNKQYRIVDISESNQGLKESQELYKESVINNISNKTIDNINEVITYREDEEIHTQDKQIDENDKDIQIDEINKMGNVEKNKNKFNKLKKRYKGVNVSVLVSGVGIIEGEIVFDFPNIIAVKNKEDIIIFIDESKILGIY